MKLFSEKVYSVMSIKEKYSNIAQLCLIENPLLYPRSIPKTLLYPGSTNTKYSYSTALHPSLLWWETSASNTEIQEVQCQRLA